MSAMASKCVIVPISACLYAIIVSPLLVFVANGPVADLPFDRQLQDIMAPRLENKVIWPALAVISLVLALRNGAKLTLPPHIVCLLAYLAFAGASVLWAFKPELSFTRFA